MDKELPKGRGLWAAKNWGGHQGVLPGTARQGEECSGVALGDPEEEGDWEGTCKD